jgi:NAD(P)-dependent dehydrogenase (short-subunit alcohol dehydrogenase family)
MHHPQDLADKVILITGATDGIGKAAALDFARRGAQLTLVGRNPAKTEAVVAELRRATSNDTLDFLLCDLARMAEVRQAAQAFRRKHDRLDVLVNNAGAMYKAPVLGPDGAELTFTVNHLAYFQLTTALLDLIRATPHARVVSTTSAMHVHGRLDPKVTPTSLEGTNMQAYANSKLANVIFTRELQRRLADTTATANCVHPGMVKSRFGAFGEDIGLLSRILFTLALPFAKTPEAGADSLIWVATSSEAAGLQGAYVADRQALTPSKLARDEKLAEALWLESERLCALA